MKTTTINFDIDRFNKGNYISLQTKCGYPVTIYSTHGKDDEYDKKYVIHGCYTRDNNDYVNRWSLEGDSEESWSSDISAYNLQMKVIDYYEENDIVKFTIEGSEFIGAIDTMDFTNKHKQVVNCKIAVSKNKIYYDYSSLVEKTEMATPQEIKIFNCVVDSNAFKIGDTIKVKDIVDGVCYGKVYDSFYKKITAWYWNGNEMKFSYFDTGVVEKVSEDEFNVHDPLFRKDDIIEVSDKYSGAVYTVKLIDDFDYTKIVGLDCHGIKREFENLDIDLFEGATSEERAIYYNVPYSYSNYEEDYAEDKSEVDDSLKILSKLIKLRDAYRKGWIPSADNTIKYCIICSSDGISYSLESTTLSSTNAILMFQTAELRDLFLNNFGSMIENVKYLI